MKKTKIIYWIFTGLLAVLMLFGSVPGILNSPDAVALVTTHLGYPSYFLLFISVAKILGVAAILVPGFPGIREWAYAGFVFDLTGAIYSSIAVGDTAGQWMPLFIGIILIAVSYIYHHKILSQRIAERNAVSMSNTK